MIKICILITLFVQTCYFYPCVSPHDCTGYVNLPACIKGQCGPCEVEGQCIQGKHCNSTNGYCYSCLNHDHCSQSDSPSCISNTCAKCTKKEDCSGQTSICETQSGKCVQCTQNSDCSIEAPQCNASTFKCEKCTSNSGCPVERNQCQVSTGQCFLCYEDSHCSATPNTPSCLDNQCKKKCTDNSGCENSQICDLSTGKCHQCVQHGDCPLTNSCQNFTCKKCNYDSQCSSSQKCSPFNNKCVECFELSHCDSQGLACINNQCTGCTEDNQCSTSKCNKTTKKCVECVGKSDCIATHKSWCDTTNGKCTVCRDNNDCYGFFPFCHPNGKTGCIKKDVECKSNGNCLDVTKSQCSNYACSQCQINDHCSHLKDTPICHPQQNKCVQKIESDFLQNCCQNSYNLVIKKPSQQVSKPAEDLVFEKGAQEIKLEFEIQTPQQFVLEYIFRQAFANGQMVQPISVEIVNNSKITVKLNPSTFAQDTKIEIIFQIKDNRVRRILVGAEYVKFDEKITVVADKNEYISQINNNQKPNDNNNNNNNNNNINQNQTKAKKSDGDDDEDKKKTIIVVLVILGVFVLISSLVGISYLLYKKKLKQKKQDLYSEAQHTEQVKTIQNEEQKV